MLLIPTRLAQSTIHGLGVFATEPVAKGTPVWRFAKGFDMEYDTSVLDTLPPHARTFFSHYGYVDYHLKRLIMCIDDGRFVNHSTTPNLDTDYTLDPYGLDVALRDIAAGEELTMDYGKFEKLDERGM